MFLQITAVLYNEAYQFYNVNNLEKCLSSLSDLVLVDADHSEALELMKKVNKIKELKESGNASYREKDFLGARKFYRKAIKIDPKNKAVSSVLHYNLAASNFYLLNYKEALNNATSALRFDGKYVKAFLVRAKCSFRLKKFDDCINDCKVILAIENNYEIQELLTDCRHHVFIEDAIAQANLKFHMEDFRNCISECAEILRFKEIEEVRTLLNESSKLLIIKAQNIYYAGDYESCIEDCDTILNYQHCSETLKGKALTQIACHKDLNEIMVRFKQNFEKKNYKNCLADSNFFYSTLEKIEDKKDQYNKIDDILTNIRDIIENYIKEAYQDFNTGKIKECIKKCQYILTIDESLETENLLQSAKSKQTNFFAKAKKIKECLEQCSLILENENSADLLFLIDCCNTAFEEDKTNKTKLQIMLSGKENMKKECFKKRNYILNIEYSSENSK